MFSYGILESACLSVCVQILVFSKSVGRDIKSYLVTALVMPSQNECFRGMLESPCLSVCPSVYPSVYKILVFVKVLAGLLSHI